MVYLDYVAEQRWNLNVSEKRTSKGLKNNNTNMLISSVNQRKVKTWFSK